MEINTISSFNRDQRARVSDNTKVGAALGTVAGALTAQRVLQNGFKSQGYTDTFLKNVKNFANAKTTAKSVATEKIKMNIKTLANNIKNNKFARGGAVGAALVAGTVLATLVGAKIAKDSTELKIAKETLD